VPSPSTASQGRLFGTRLFFPLAPGTSVPGFPMSPLRGWSLVASRYGQILLVCEILLGQPQLQSALLLGGELDEADA
jgi:hypothetical protein